MLASPRPVAAERISEFEGDIPVINSAMSYLYIPRGSALREMIKRTEFAGEVLAARGAPPYIPSRVFGLRIAPDPLGGRHVGLEGDFPMSVDAMPLQDARGQSNPQCGDFYPEPSLSLYDAAILTPPAVIL